MEVQSVTLPNEDIVIYATTNQSSNSYEGKEKKLLSIQVETGFLM